MMNKQWVLGLGLALTTSLSSCYSKLHLTELPEFREYSGKKGVWVMKVKTLQGDSVLYSRKYPGMIKDTTVIAYTSHLVTIKKSQVDSIRQNFNETRISHFWLDGQKYAIKKDEDFTYGYLMPDTIFLSLNNIAEIDAIKFEKTRSILFTFSTISTAIGIFIVYFIATFSWDLGV